MRRRAVELTLQAIFHNLYSRDKPLRTAAVWAMAKLALAPVIGGRALIRAALSHDDDRATRGGRYWNRGWEEVPRPEVDDAKLRAALWARSATEAGLSGDVLLP